VLALSVMFCLRKVYYIVEKMVFAKENDVGDFTNIFSVVEVCFLC